MVSFVLHVLRCVRGIEAYDLSFCDAGTLFFKNLHVSLVPREKSFIIFFFFPPLIPSFLPPPLSARLDPIQCCQIPPSLHGRFCQKPRPVWTLSLPAKSFFTAGFTAGFMATLRLHFYLFHEKKTTYQIL